MSKGPRQPTYDPNLVEVKAKVSNTGITLASYTHLIFLVEKHTNLCHKVNSCTLLLIV